MPSLVEHLTTAPLLIGVITSIQSIFWLVPQIFAARVVAGRQRKLPVVLINTGISRLGWLILLVALSFPGAFGPRSTLVAVYLSLAVFYLFDGIATLGWFDVLARTVPASIRGRLFGMMALGGGVFGIGGGLIVERVVGQSAFPFPSDYRLLVALALLAFSIGMIPLLLLREADGESTQPPEPVLSYFRRLPDVLRQRPDFRRLVAVQLLVGFASLAVPYYAPYGVLRLGLPESSVGSFVLAVTLGGMIGGVVWGFLGDHGQLPRAIKGVALATLLAPTVPVLLAAARGGSAAPAVGGLLAVSFFLVGCNRSGWVAYMNYLMGIAEPADRPVYIGLMNTLAGILAIGPPLGGLLVSAFGYEAAFIAAALPAAAGLAISFRLTK